MALSWRAGAFTAGGCKHANAADGLLRIGDIEVVVGIQGDVDCKDWPGAEPLSLQGDLRDLFVRDDKEMVLAIEGERPAELVAVESMLSPGADKRAFGVKICIGFSRSVTKTRPRLSIAIVPGE